MTNLQPNVFCENCTRPSVLIYESTHYCAQCYIDKLEAEDNEKMNNEVKV